MVRCLTRFALSLPISVALSLVLVGQTLAATWVGPGPITGWGTYGAGIVSTGGSGVALLFHGPGGAYVKRSMDAGVTWKPRIRVTSGGDGGAVIDGLGSGIDVLWADSTVEWADGPNVLTYRRSTNGGRSFEPPVPIANVGEYNPWINSFDVARGPAGLVAVMWDEIEWFDVGGDDRYRRYIRVRVSSDGGASFGPAQLIATVRGPGSSALAVGDGVIYVAYLRQQNELRLKRSLDGGEHWSQGSTLAWNAYNLWSPFPPVLVAEGSDAYVAWTRQGSGYQWLVYWRTTDSGAHWSTSLKLAAGDRRQHENLNMSLDDGVLRAAYWRCPSNCEVAGQGEIYFRQSVNGLTWSPTVMVAPSYEPNWRGYYPSDLAHVGSDSLILMNEWRDFWDENGSIDSEARALLIRGTP